MIRAELLQKYKDFSIKYSPQNKYIYTNSAYKGIIYVTYENLLLCNILEEYKHLVPERSKKEYSELISLLNYHHTKFLLSILNNDYLYFCYLSRTISELILKMFLLLNTSDNDLDLTKESFRFLKSDIKKILKSSEFKESILIKDDIEKLEFRFSKFSNVIHTNQHENLNTIEYLSNQFTNEPKKLLEILKFFQEVNHSFYFLIFHSIGLNFNKLGSVQRTQLSEQLKEKKFNTVKSKYLSF